MHKQNDTDKLFQKIKENGLAVERMEREMERLKSELGLTKESAKEALSNPSLFSEEIWEELQKKKKELEESLNLKMKNIRDPSKQEKKFNERTQVQQHWLFIR